MRLDTQVFLRLAEKAQTIVFLDCESTGLKGDYNSILTVSLKPFGKAVTTYHVDKIGYDQQTVTQAKEFLESHDCWVTYFGKGFDIPLLNTRLLRWGIRPVEKRHHIDMYFTLKANILTGRRSQGHLLSWLRLPEQKMTVSAELWNEVMHDRTKMATMIKRCESDVRGLQALYSRTKHLIRDISL